MEIPCGWGCGPGVDWLYKHIPWAGTPTILQSLHQVSSCLHRAPWQTYTHVCHTCSGYWLKHLSYTAQCLGLPPGECVSLISSCPFSYSISSLGNTTSPSLQSTSRQPSSQSTSWHLSSGDHGNGCAASVGTVSGTGDVHNVAATLTQTLRLNLSFPKAWGTLH